MLALRTIFNILVKEREHTTLQPHVVYEPQALQWLVPSPITRTEPLPD